MFDAIKSVWEKFARQPGNRSLLLLIALLVLTISLLAPAEPDPEQIATQISDQAVEQTDVLPEQSTQPGLILQTDGQLPAQIADPGAVLITGQLDEQSGEQLDEQPVEQIAAETPDTTTPATTLADDITRPSEPAAKLVLIIDDIGYNAEAGVRAINLPGAVTYAVIPYTPHGQALAESAHRANKEVMLHAPMSNLSGMDLGQGGLTLQQNEEEFRQTLRLALDNIPHIKGLNNHTGSELTAAVQPMQWLMQELKQRGLYFVDSVTTRVSVAAATAEQSQVPSLRRHVFLDNVQTADAIDVEFKRALALAQKQGFAVAIGHPYPETLRYLESALPVLATQNIQLVSASSMIAELKTKTEPEITTTVAW